MVTVGFMFGLRSYDSDCYRHWSWSTHVSYPLFSLPFPLPSNLHHPHPPTPANLQQNLQLRLLHRLRSLRRAGRHVRRHPHLHRPRRTPRARLPLQPHAHQRQQTARFHVGLRVPGCAFDGVVGKMGLMGNGGKRGVYKHQDIKMGQGKDERKKEWRGTKEGGRIWSMTLKCSG